MKRLCVLGLLWVLCSLPVRAAEMPDWSEYDMEEIEKEMRQLEKEEYYDEEAVGYGSFTDLLRAVMSGDIRLSFSEVVSRLWAMVVQEIQGQGRAILELAVFLILSGLLKNLDISFGNTQVGQVAFYVLFSAAVALLFRSFTGAYQIASSVGGRVSRLLLCLIPVLAAVKTASGGQISAMVESGMLIGGIDFASWLVQNVFFFGILLFIVFASVGQLAGQNMTGRLSKLAKTLVQKGIKAVSGLFLFLMGLQGLSAGAADTWVKKTMISAAGAVPVVGDAIGGAVNAVFAGAELIGRCVGSAGVILLMGICLIPLARLAAIWLLYKVGAALLSPISDPKLTELIDAAADAIGMLMGVLIVLIGMFLCGLGIFLRGV